MTLSQTLFLVNFKTKGCTADDCITPTSLYADDTYFNKESVRLQWFDGRAAQYYIDYRLLSDSTNNTWKRDSSEFPFTVLKNLKPCETYIAHVKASCETNDNITSKAVFFKTFCPTDQYCLSDPISFDVEFYDSDTLAHFSWHTISTFPRYYNLTIRSHDSSFFKNIATGDTIANISLPSCTSFEILIQTICFYRINTGVKYYFRTGNCLRCGTVSQLAIKNIGDSAMVNWSINQTVNSYQLQFKLAGDVAWSKVISTTASNCVINNLKNCYTYIVRVRAVCDSTNELGQWTEARFKPGTNCLRGVNQGAISNAKATISVSPNPGSENPTVVYKLESTSTVKIDVINLYGSILEIWNAGELPEGEYSYKFTQLENLPTGLYLIRLRTDGDVSRTIKWIKN